MADKKKQLAFNIIDFLRTSVKDGSIKEDDGESMEIAVQCISEAFSINPDSPEEASKYAIAPATLSTIFDVFLRTKERAEASAAASAAPAPEKKATEGEKKPATDAEKKKAEALKAEGNALMSKKPKPDHVGAIKKYTEAIALDGGNPVFFSNRAAAYGARGEHDKAIEDAEEAVKIDPAFGKGWSRLGHAHYSLNDYPSSIRAYRKGLLVDPSNKNMQEAIKTARQRLKEEGGKEVNSDGEDEEEEEEVEDLGVAEGSRGGGMGGGAGGMPDLSALAGMFGGGGAGGGGMPDIAAMMQNPALMQMAQNMMANGGLENLMSNPAIRQMAEKMGGGGAGRGA